MLGRLDAAISKMDEIPADYIKGAIAHGRIHLRHVEPVSVGVTGVIANHNNLHHLQRGACCDDCQGVERNDHDPRIATKRDVVVKGVRIFVFGCVKTP